MSSRAFNKLRLFGVALAAAGVLTACGGSPAVPSVPSLVPDTSSTQPSTDTTSLTTDPASTTYPGLTTPPAPPVAKVPVTKKTATARPTVHTTVRPAPPRKTVTTAPHKPAPPPPAPGPFVHPGAFCSPAGAHGITSKGTPMVCKLDSKGQRLRWAHA